MRRRPDLRDNATIRVGVESRKCHRGSSILAKNGSPGDTLAASGADDFQVIGLPTRKRVAMEPEPQRAIAGKPPFVQLEPVSSESSYRSGGTLGGKLGCAFAAVVGLPLIGAALIYASMGDCAPGADCIAGWKVIAGAAVIAGLAGVGARAAINAFAHSRRGGS